MYYLLFVSSLIIWESEDWRFYESSLINDKIIGTWMKCDKQVGIEKIIINKDFTYKAYYLIFYNNEGHSYIFFNFLPQTLIKPICEIREKRFLLGRGKSGNGNKWTNV